MKFLCMGYFDPEKMKALSKEEFDALMGECQIHLQAFYKSGQVILDAGVDEKGTSLQRVNGKVSVADASLVEAKAVIGSVFIIDAENLEDAVRIASLHPTTQVSAGEQLGWRIEVRPIHSFKTGDGQ